MVMGEIMQDTALDVILFLFDNYFCQGEGMPASEDEITEELEYIGFGPSKIDRAFSWLLDLAQTNPKLPKRLKKYTHRSAATFITPQSKGAVRFYADHEKEKFSEGCLEFLASLEAKKIINPEIREQIILRALLLAEHKISLGAFKRITGLVLINLKTYSELEFLLHDLDLNVEYIDGAIH